MGPSYDIIKRKIETLEFHGPTNDEMYELFAATCDLARNMAGLGERRKAYTLAEWAQELAEQSQADAEDLYPDGNCEKTKGQWG